jgi:hypothetical protein
MTILVDRHAIRGDAKAYISRLETLITHLKRLQAGQFPTAAEISSAPLLNLYEPALRPTECLIGWVEGHPRLHGAITTSELWSYSPERGWARTLSRLYRLGRPAGPRDQTH